MALVVTIDTADELKDQFKRYNRDDFSMEAYQVLVDYYHDCGDNVELDVIAICCDCNEAYWVDVQSDYSNHEDLAECDNIDDFLEALNNYTMAFQTTDDSILYFYF